MRVMDKKKTCEDCMVRNAGFEKMLEIITCPVNGFKKIIGFRTGTEMIWMPACDYHMRARARGYGYADKDGGRGQKMLELWQ